MNSPTWHQGLIANTGDRAVDAPNQPSSWAVHSTVLPAEWGQRAIFFFVFWPVVPPSALLSNRVCYAAGPLHLEDPHKRK